MTARISFAVLTGRAQRQAAAEGASPENSQATGLVRGRGALAKKARGGPTLESGPSGPTEGAGGINRYLSGTEDRGV